MNSYHEKIAKILRVDKHVIFDLEAGLEKITGKVGVLQGIVDENDAMVADRMQKLGLPKDALARDVFDALTSKIEADDVSIFAAADIISLREKNSAEKICDFVLKIGEIRDGYFMKMEKAKELLAAEPPLKIMEALGYSTVEDLLAKEDILEVYSALRFLEGSEWLNAVFFKQYENLKSEDFEIRKVQLKALSPKWIAAAEKFVAKKYHNVSHLKELGVIFVIPIFLGISGETLRLLSLLLHYLHEVNYYSGLFKHFAEGPVERFASRIISLLRGDILERRLAVPVAEAERPRWLIVQRYLAKDDENDWHLFEPHVNPEALHWERAVADIVNIPNKITGFKNGLDFWKDLGWVGDYFATEAGVSILVSFNLVDTVMALVKEKELLKYLYHQQEAMWNRIFTGYFSEEEMREAIQKHIIQGWFEV